MRTRIFTMLVAFLTMVGNAVWGQSNETMEIRSWEDFLAFRDAVKKNPQTNAILMNDIVANEDILGEDGLPNIEYEEGSGHHDYLNLNLWSWGSTSFTYSGTFDGNNCKISGIYSTGDCLFRNLTKEAIIKDLTITDSYFHGFSTTASVFAKENEGTISNCVSEATIDVRPDSHVQSGMTIAAICGINSGIIEDCISRGLIKVDMSPYEYLYGIAGISGQNNGTIRRCINECDFDIQHQEGDTGVKYPCYYVGGIVGRFILPSNQEQACLVEECYNAGDILVHGGEKTSSTSIFVGGIAGDSKAQDYDGYKATIRSCYNLGSLTVKDLNMFSSNEHSYSIGGISANPITFSNCYNIGEINAEDKSATFQNPGNLGSTGNLLLSVMDPALFNFENSYYKKNVEALCWYLSLSEGKYIPLYEVKGASEATDAQFASGEVAWLLHKGGYGQRIGTDAHPVLINLGNEGTEVYKLVLSSEEVEADTYPTYVNEGTEVTPFEDLTLEEGKTIGWYKGEDLVATGLTYIVNSADADKDATITLTAKIIDEPEEEPEQPGDDDDQDDNQGSDIHKPQRPIKYYNIYIDTICPGLNVEVSKDVVQEGHQVSAYLTIQSECDTTGMRFEYKRGLFGYWKDLKELEGVQPGEYIIKNIYTDIYIRALDATLPEEEPTGIDEVEGAKAYAKEGSIYVYTPSREEVTIISMSGAIIKHEEQVGLQSYSVSRGIYIVRIGEKVFKLKN